MNKIFLYLFVPAMVISACGESTNTKSTETSEGSQETKAKNKIHYEEETHFQNIHQLTDGGNISKSYWSFDDSKLMFQAK